LNETRRQLDRLLADRDHAARRAREEKARLKEARERVAFTQEAQRVVQEVAARVQQQAHDRIASVVSRCLAAVFGEDAYQFRIDFEQKRGRTEAKLVFVRGDLVLEDPTGESGGGQVDVAALALRLACLALSRPRKRLLLCLDEPMRNVNGEVYQERVGQLLLTLAEEMGVQFVVVSDDDWLKVGKVIEL